MVAFPSQPQPTPAGGSPLSAEQLGEFRDAEERRRILRRAAGVASADAWLGAVFAGLSLLSAVFSLPGLFLGLALTVVAWNSFRGARGLITDRLHRRPPAAG